MCVSSLCKHGKADVVIAVVVVIAHPSHTFNVKPLTGEQQQQAGTYAERTLSKEGKEMKAVKERAQ